jgi:hypothetical protein
MVEVSNNLNLPLLFTLSCAFRFEKCPRRTPHSVLSTADGDGMMDETS